MKEIGQTREGKILVEMTESEYETFGLLESAIMGSPSSFWPEMKRHPVSGINLSQAFIAIREFVQGQFYINSMQHYVNKLKETMGAVKPDEPR